MELLEAATTLIKHCKNTGQKCGNFEMKSPKYKNLFAIPITTNRKLPKNKLVLKSEDGNTIGAFRFDDQS